jgi:hypothetical protein
VVDLGGAGSRDLVFGGFSAGKSWSAPLMVCIWCRGIWFWGEGGSSGFWIRGVHLFGVPDEDAVRGDAKEIEELNRPCFTV